MSHRHLWIDVWLVANIIMFFYFLCCFVIVTSAFPEAEHGVGGRIAGGKEPVTGARAFRFQAQISRESGTFCSGAILNDRYIVTAAHCVEGARPEELTVRIGSNIRGEGMVIPIEKIVQHPDYDYPQNNFDIAYMRTAIRIVYGRTIRGTHIASPKASVPRDFIVTGWGYQENNQTKLADKLRSVELPVISNVECQVFYPMMSITKNMICGYSLRDMDKGTCVGDGGDPATVFTRLVGVSSAAIGCGPGMGPSVFTYLDAAEIRNFILNGTSDGNDHPAGLPKPKPPSNRLEKATKTPKSDSENPEESPEKVAKTPAGVPDYPQERPGDLLSKREDTAEQPEEL